jgi:Fic family protein
MDISQFKSGSYIADYQYNSFRPEPVNRLWVVSDPEIQVLLEQANLNLGALDAFSTIVPDVDTFIRMHVVKEATASSRIEGTQTDIEQAVLRERDVRSEHRDDWREVQNYIRAMHGAITQLDELPLSNRLLRNTHKTLLQDVRGKHRQPGEFRKSQNWIGGTSVKDASFIPPVHTEVPEAMSDLEKFLNNNLLPIPHLIRIGMAHYQFETIHPFLDGNGRLGRLLITLYLVKHGVLYKPTLYLSDFFNKNKGHYYDNLMLVRRTHDLSQWLRFFLVAVLETALSGVNTFKAVLKLRSELEDSRIIELNRKIPLAKSLLEYLYKKPVITAMDVEEDLSVSKPTANAIIKDFQRLNILKEQTGYKRNRIFVFEAYTALFNQ